LSPDGTFRDIVLSKHDGVDRPRSITFNNDFTKLFIINDGGESVLVSSFTKNKNPSFTKYKNPSFIKYKNPSFTKNKDPYFYIL
jgi:hypothetical protein